MIVIKLKQLLNNRGMSQSELARAADIRPSTICDLYNQNASFIKLENLYKICRYLRCSTDDLF